MSVIRDVINKVKQQDPYDSSFTSVEEVMESLEPTVKSTRVRQSKDLRAHR